MVENIPPILLQILIRVLIQTPNSMLFFGCQFDQYEIKKYKQSIRKGLLLSEFQLKIYLYMYIIK